MKAQNLQVVKPAPQPNQAVVTEKAVKSLANSIFRQLRQEGCAHRDIISVSTQLLDLVTCEIQSKAESAQ